MQGLLNSANFYLPFYDSGAGAVNTAEYYGTTPTFTRATVAWTKLASGLWAQVASGTARSFYTGFTTAVGTYAGYLAEGARTQLVTPDANIRDMTGVGWAAVTMTVAKTATGIDGVVNSATTLTATGAGATVLHLLVAAASDRTYSAWIRRVTGTGTVKLVQGATKSSDFAGSINASTYTRVELDASVDVTLLGYGIELGTSGDVIEVDFNQFEAGAFASTPIPAAGARNADVLTYPSTVIQASAGTIYIDLLQIGVGARAYGVYATSVVDGSTELGLRVGGSGSAQAIFVWGDGAAANSIQSGALSASVSHKMACAWSTSTAAIAHDGVLDDSTSITNGAVVTTLAIGANGGGAFPVFGPIRSVAYWNSRLPDATLQALTA